MSNPVASLATLIMLADASPASKGHAPSLARPRNLRTLAVLESTDDLALRNGEIPSEAGAWVTPVHTQGQDRQTLNAEIVAVNVARNRALRIAYRNGKACLREYGKTLCEGTIADLREHLTDAPKRSEKMARFLAMGDSETEAVSMLDAHVAEMYEGSVASGQVAHVDGDEAFQVSTAHRG